MHGTYRLGFLNSILLAAITSVVPGILGVFLAYAIETSAAACCVASRDRLGCARQLRGINLTFMFIATLGSTGVLTAWLSVAHSIRGTTFQPLLLLRRSRSFYLYFQIPLMVLVITPALGGLRPAWREAAENLGASSFRYWRTVGIPVLLPSVLGECCFCSAAFRCLRHG